MADPDFRAAQHARLHEPHVAEITSFVDELRRCGKGFVPYVAPTYGGQDAEVLLIFQDPGPMADRAAGSGMLCSENDDPSAELLACSLDDAALPVARVITWNAYPWYINKKPSAAQVKDGLEPLHRLVALLPRLTVVMPMGRVAQDSWNRYLKLFPGGQRYHRIDSLHTSRRGITSGGQTSRAAGIDRLVRDLRRALDHADSHRSSPDATRGPSEERSMM